MLNKYYLYRHIRLDTNQPFYIGIGSKSNNSKNISTEYLRAFNKSKRKQFWKNIVSKTDYKVEIVYECNDYEEIKNKEKGTNISKAAKYNKTAFGYKWKYKNETKQRLQVCI